VGERDSGRKREGYRLREREDRKRDSLGILGEGSEKVNERTRYGRMGERKRKEGR
jgi:hypothetical protein